MSRVQLPLVTPIYFQHDLAFWGPVKEDEFSLEPLKKASKTLRDALKEVKTDFIRDAVIQRFKYTYELAWKTMRRYFKLNNQLEEENIQNIFREAGRQKLIGSVEHWFGYQKARNQTSHTYDQNIAEQVYIAAQSLSVDVDDFINRLEKVLGRTS